MKLILAFTLALLFIHSLAQPYPQGDIDFSKLPGTWFEIASIKQDWEQNCSCTTFTFGDPVHYLMNVTASCKTPEKQLDVQGYLGFLETPLGKLPGQYQFIFNGKRTIEFYIKVDPSYNYIVLGQPPAYAFTILSRTPQFDEKTYSKLIRMAEKDFKFDVSKISRTYQQSDCQYSLIDE